ncbi:MAG: glycosyltransferase [Syntrophales bacterium]
MDSLLSILQWIFLIPVAAGSIYGILCLLAILRFQSRPAQSLFAFSSWPPVTVLKPVCGLEKNQKTNLRSACLQAYPDFQVVFSVQDSRDPALPLLKEIQREFPDRACVSVDGRRAGTNGKINNLIGALMLARNEILVISDSDVYLEPDYLKNLIAPLADPQVGFACTLYRAASSGGWFERLFLLSLNADFIPSVVFAYVTGVSKFCLGSSVAFRRGLLERTGGIERFADHLAEDYEMGRHFLMSGKKMVLVPYLVRIDLNLQGPRQWWNSQVCWDQKTHAANRAGFFATVAVRSIPFALLFAAVRLGDGPGLAVLFAALVLRLGTAGAAMGLGLHDKDGLKSLLLLPLRDVAALVSWVFALAKKKVVWRGSEFIVARDGRLRKKASLEEETHCHRR